MVVDASKERDVQHQLAAGDVGVGDVVVEIADRPEEMGPEAGEVRVDAVGAQPAHVAMAREPLRDAGVPLLVRDEGVEDGSQDRIGGAASLLREERADQPLDASHVGEELHDELLVGGTERRPAARPAAAPPRVRTPPAPRSCAELGYDCGPASNGCGATLDYGACPAGQTCGGWGQPGVCAGGCDCCPVTCMQMGIHCGPAGDGCGGVIDCGPCPPGQVCGGGGVPGQCGGGCALKTCAQLGVECGFAADGCGGVLDCGTCPTSSCPPITCGGGGVPGVCGGPLCVCKTCQQVGVNCGPAGDGCGGLLDCGGCPSGQTCGGGAVPGQCG